MQCSQVVSDVSEEYSDTIFRVEKLAEGEKGGRRGALTEQTECRMHEVLAF